MSAYGDITCEWCCAVYHEQDHHECTRQDVEDEITRLRAEVDTHHNQYRKWVDAICERDDEIDRLKTTLKNIMVVCENLMEHPEIHLTYKLAAAALRGDGN